MKNFCDSLKIFVVGLLFSSVMSFSVNCSAVDYRSDSVSNLKHYIGNWYDTNGNLVLTISRDYVVLGIRSGM